MSRQEGKKTEGPPAFPHPTEVVELHLLLPGCQFTALEAVAARSHLTVATLLRRTISDFLRPTAGVCVKDDPAVGWPTVRRPSQGELNDPDRR